MSETKKDEVFRRLYKSEINFSISCFWDGGFDVKLGDEMNGWEASANVDTWDEIAPWLDENACRIWPDSVYARSPSPPKEVTSE